MTKSRIIFPLLALVIFLASFVSACGREELRLEGECINISSATVNSNDPRSTFYCMGKVNKEIDNNVEKLLVELSYGVSNPKDFNDKAHRWVEITARNANTDEKYLIKKINGKQFYTEKYLYSKSGEDFNHTEIIKVPTSLLSNEEGWLIITVAEMNEFNALSDGLDCLGIYFKK